MEIILLERVENLGAIGDVVKVKNGFARNYLFPQHKALLATDANKARFERERRVRGGEVLPWAVGAHRFAGRSGVARGRGWCGQGGGGSRR